MTSAEIRQSFVDFFAERGHRPVPSSPLVPHGDATLLFTNAGMVQFKDFFTGAATADFRRAVTVQKCLRVSGKHNDLENVGPSPRHHTFFEMLGNFSFGDYFKAEAIEWGWELVTRRWGLDPDHLFASVYEQDDEAAELWRKISGLPVERIVRCGEADNFWAMGETGPCGPCSEIYVDRRPGTPHVPWQEGTDSGRYLEIWNLVFMQFERSKSADGTIATASLPKPSIDTGAGLERVAAVLAGVDSNYDTDLFGPILEGAATLAKTSYGRNSDHDVSLRVVADHLRAVSFLLADGVVPANDGRGYVLRRLLRRAVRHGMRLGFEEPFLCRLLPLVDEAMAGHYTELAATRAASEATIRAEEEKFLATVAIGSKMVQEAIEEAKKGGSKVLPGPIAFRLYDTYGLPIQLLEEIVEEEKFGLDRAGFEAALDEQRERSRAATGAKQDELLGLQDLLAKSPETAKATEFVGYLESGGPTDEKLSIEGVRVLAAVPQGATGGGAGSGSEASRGGVGTGEGIAAGQRGWVVFDRTNFYAESGGQVGDRGEMVWGEGSARGRARVLDTRKDTAGRFLHLVEVVEGKIGSSSPSMNLFVFPAHRLPTQRNHTATHLLHAALRQVLGEGVRQAGSLVAPDHLRFDFTCGKPVTKAERARIEEMVNSWVLRAAPVTITADRPVAEALAAGAMALFGEKYGERVRTVEVPGGGEGLPTRSLELCGGCHVRNSGEVGPFVIRAERGVASGVRRIEALTGEGALAFLRERDEELARVEARLGAATGGATEKVAALEAALAAKEKELAKLRREIVSGASGSAVSGESEAAGIRIVAREVPWAPAPELRNLVDELRAKSGAGIVLLGARSEGKVMLVAAAAEDVRGRVGAGRLLKEVAALVGGSGGGRDDFAQAGGKQPERLDEALAAVPTLVEKLVGANS